MSGPETIFFFVVIPFLVVWILTSVLRCELAEKAEAGDPPPSRWPTAHPPPLRPSRLTRDGSSWVNSLYDSVEVVRELEALCASKLQVGDLVELDDETLKRFVYRHPHTAYRANHRYEGQMGLVLAIEPGRGSVWGSPGVLLSIWGSGPRWHSPALWRPVCRPEGQ